MKKILPMLLICLLLSACSLMLAPSPSEEPAGELRIRFLDVGQADAALLFCEGETMLIDGGNKGDGDLIYTVLRDEGVDVLDYVVCTHAHEDHVGGLASALTAAEAEVIYCPVTEYDSRAFENFAKKAGEITVPEAGDTFYLGGALVEILSCDPDAEEVNDSSIVLRLTYGEISFLFTGDAERPVEQALLEAGTDVSAHVLKVGHHGSSTSTSYRFLNEVMPQYAIISVGEGNSYGHPHDEVLSRLEDADVTVYRTDELGDITCVCDGDTLEFTFQK